MITADLVLDALKRFDVDDDTLAQWEADLGLHIPTDASGGKMYSIHHINLFKNVRKHLALGRSMAEVRDILSPLPETTTPLFDVDVTLSESSAPFVPVSVNPEFLKSEFLPESFQMQASDSGDMPETPTSLGQFMEQPTPATIPGSSIKNQTRFTTRVPSPNTSEYQALQADMADLHMPPVMMPEQEAFQHRPQSPSSRSSGASTSSSSVSSMPLALTNSQETGLLSVINRLIDEKEAQQKRLVQIEKLNSHLYNANALFQQRLKTVTSDLEGLRTSVSDSEVTKLLNDKSKLHKQLLDIERVSQHRMLELAQREKEIEGLQTRIEQMESRLQNPIQSFDPASFVGDWHEQGQLLAIRFDNFGMNIEPRRSRTFKIPMIPEQLYGNTAVIYTEYRYDANPMWQRRETMTLCHVQDGRLDGELMTEYILDGVPVAQAVYRIACQKLR